MGEQSLLVRTIVTSLPDEQDADFLQILTTESGEIVEAAVMVVKQSIVELYPPTPLTDAELDRRGRGRRTPGAVGDHPARPSPHAKPPPTSPGSSAWPSRAPKADYGEGVGVVGTLGVGVLGVGTVGVVSEGAGVVGVEPPVASCVT